MTKKLLEIIESIKLDTSRLYCENAFKCFIDNQITVDELDEILKADNYILPDSFFELSIKDQKNYMNHIQTRIYFENGEEKFYWYQVFNKPYFYDLAEHARKTKWITNKLIEYVNDFGNDSINLLFLGFQYIKLNVSPLWNYQTIRDYAESKNINDIYELLISLFIDLGTKEVVQLRNLVFEKIKKENMFNADLNDKFFYFALLMECAIALLPRKEANTIKVKFQILSAKELRDIDYYSDPDRQNRILNTFKKKMTSNKVLNMISGYIIDNQEFFDTMKPNGYASVYYYLMEEGLWFDT